MPTIDQEFVVEVPREQAWQFFVDIPSAAACVPGFQGIEATGPQSYTGKLQTKLGMFQPTFAGEMEIVELAQPNRLVAKLRGKDLKSFSVLTVTTSLDLEEVTPRQTRVRFHADVSIMGSLGNFGWSLFERQAQAIGDQFAACARDRLRTGVPGGKES